MRKKIRLVRDRMHQAKLTKVALARQLGVSRASLYSTPKKPVHDAQDVEQIRAVMAEHPAYGQRRVAMVLHMNRKRARRLMRTFGLQPLLRRGRRHVKPDDCGRPETQVTNVLKLLCPLAPNVVWAGDFTYLWFQDRFWYVATVIDVHTREIVGWHIANHHTTSLIMDAFSDAVRRTGTAPTSFHSDQGSEYVAGAYASLLQQHGTTPSQSRKASPWQNGFQESFYNNFKLELGDVRRFGHVGELVEAVHRQMHYYNTERIHSALKMPPVSYRQSRERPKTAVAQAA